MSYNLFFSPQNSCGFIERDDLKKFSFAFNAFYGIEAHLVPGVKVHFTVVKTMVSVCVFDVLIELFLDYNSFGYFREKKWRLT